MTGFETAIGRGVKTRFERDQMVEMSKMKLLVGMGVERRRKEARARAEIKMGREVRGKEVRAHLMVLSKGRNDSQCLYLSLTLRSEMAASNCLDVQYKYNKFLCV